MYNEDIVTLSNYRLFYREKSDYVDFYIITKEECKAQIENAKMAVKLVSEYIDKWFNK